MIDPALLLAFVQRLEAEAFAEDAAAEPMLSAACTSLHTTVTGARLNARAVRALEIAASLRRSFDLGSRTQLVRLEGE